MGVLTGPVLSWDCPSRELFSLGLNDACLPERTLPTYHDAGREQPVPMTTLAPQRPLKVCTVCMSDPSRAKGRTGLKLEPSFLQDTSPAPPSEPHDFPSPSVFSFSILDPQSSMAPTATTILQG